MDELLLVDFVCGDEVEGTPFADTECRVMVVSRSECIPAAAPAFPKVSTSGVERECLAIDMEIMLELEEEEDGADVREWSDKAAGVTESGVMDGLIGELV